MVEAKPEKQQAVATQCRSDVVRHLFFFFSECRQEKLEIIEEVKGSSTPLDVLRDLSITFPLNSGMKVDELRFETGKKVKMWGRCGSYKELASIEQILNDSKRFTDVKRDQVSRSVNNTVKFVVSMTVK